MKEKTRKRWHQFWGIIFISSGLLVIIYAGGIKFIPGMIYCPSFYEIDLGHFSGEVFSEEEFKKAGGYESFFGFERFFIEETEEFDSVPWDVVIYGYNNIIKDSDLSEMYLLGSRVVPEDCNTIQQAKKVIKPFGNDFWKSSLWKVKGVVSKLDDKGKIIALKVLPGRWIFSCVIVIIFTLFLGGILIFGGTLFLIIDKTSK